MKRNKRIRLLFTFATAILIISYAQTAYLNAIIKHIYSNKQNTAEQALLAACQRNDTNDFNPEIIDSVFTSYLKNWKSFAPYTLSVIDAEGKVEFLSDRTGGKPFSKCYHFQIPCKNSGDHVVEVEYDYKAAFFDNINSVMPVTVVLNSIILVLIILLIAYLKRKETLISAKESFISIVAHNLRNPIAVAHAAAEALSASEEFKKDQSSKSLVDIIIRQLDTLNHQVESVLKKARTGKRYGKDDFVEIELLSFVEDVVSSHALSHPEAVFTIDIDPSHVMKAVPEQLSSIISVLVDNSIKYSPGTPEITIYTRRCKRGKMSISIKDNGIGFSKKEKKKAFQEFSRGKRGRLIDTSGFGLGLHYVKQTVRENHWKISLNSMEGAGSTFTISG